MTANRRSKLKKLIEIHTPGTVSLASWLEAQGISRDLQKYYRRSGWLEPVGRGVYKRPNDQVGWEGALHALQHQARLPVHVGGLTALTKQGLNQYLRLGREHVYLFSPLGVRLPSWFSRSDWGVQMTHVRSNFLPTELGVGDMKEMGYSSSASPFNLKISQPERAIMESLYLAPKEQALVEVYEIMEGLVNLRPKIVQQLLEACTSVKVKRLFLYLAEKAGHKWLQFMSRENIGLGAGDRSITANGVYVSKYQISIPKELVNNDLT